MTEEDFLPEGPQPLVREFPKGEAYPVEALGPLRAAVEAVQGMTLAPVAIAAQSALAVASLAVMPYANVETLNGASPTSLYLMTIAQSGERKSSCDSQFMKVVVEFEKAEAKKRSREMIAWKNQCDIFKEKRKAIMVRAKEGDPAALVELDDLGQEPVPPPSTDRFVTDPTYEGLTRAYRDGFPALGIFSDEGGQFLGGYALSADNRTRSLSAFNNLWQGNPIKRTTQGDGGLVLHGRRLAIHLMVQPILAREFMADPQTVETGFMPRFLIAEPPSNIGNRMQADVKMPTFEMSAFEVRLLERLEGKPKMDWHTRELLPRTIKLSESARSQLSAYYDAVEAKQRPYSPLRNVTGFASKSAEQAARIAGVLTLWEDLAAKDVSGETMANAIKLAQYYLSESLRLVQGAVADAVIENAEKLRVWLLETWEQPEITRQEIVQLGPNCVRDVKRAKSAINILADHGWLMPLPAGTKIRGAARTHAWKFVKF